MCIYSIQVATICTLSGYHPNVKLLSAVYCKKQLGKNASQISGSKLGTLTRRAHQMPRKLCYMPRPFMDLALPSTCRKCPKMLTKSHGAKAHIVFAFTMARVLSMVALPMVSGLPTNCLEDWRIGLFKAYTVARSCCLLFTNYTFKKR